jgi:hypothetical protein
MNSTIEEFARVKLPSFTGLRIMMMPIRLNDVRTIPKMLGGWRDVVIRLTELCRMWSGVGYITIDEAHVKAGETHRRPGMHVDGDLWGGGGPWARNGMLLVSSHAGCRGWHQDFGGAPGEDGDCSHLADQCDPLAEVVMQPGVVYHCNPTAVHESMLMTQDTARQFCRLSMPSDAPWYEGYTENPLGVKPGGPILPRREKQMGFRQ